MWIRIRNTGSSRAHTTDDMVPVFVHGSCNLVAVRLCGPTARAVAPPAGRVPRGRRLLCHLLPQPGHTQPRPGQLSASLVFFSYILFKVSFSVFSSKSQPTPAPSPHPLIINPTYIQGQFVKGYFLSLSPD
jgi:hypothetical protein